MAIFTNRQGSISMFRVGVAVAILGVILVAGGAIFYFIDETRRESPFEVDVYPGAVMISQQDLRPTFRKTIYKLIGDDTEAVRAFYQAKMDDHYDQNPNDPFRDEQCVRQPADPNLQLEGYQIGAGNIPFFIRCLFENSTNFSTQHTTVTIEPGVRKDGEGGFDNTGSIFITYEQYWSD